MNRSQRKRENVQKGRPMDEGVYPEPEVTAYQLAEAWQAWLASFSQGGGPEARRYDDALALNDRAIAEHKAYVAGALQVQAESEGRP